MDGSLADELRELYSREGIPFSMKSNIVVVGDPATFKVFKREDDAVMYSFSMLAAFYGRRLPEHIHNMMVLDISGSPYVKRYMEALRAEP